MNKKLSPFIAFFSLILVLNIFCGYSQDIVKHAPKLENPFSASFLENNLADGKPRLVYNQQILNDLRKKIQDDDVVRHMYEVVRYNAFQFLDQPLLERIMTGRRLLSVSRGMLSRINMLGVVYLVENDAVILERINQELLAVCNFSDWNPSHFLDVAEMSLAVALAVDWTQDRLPEETIRVAKNALIEKGLKAGWPAEGSPQPWWVTTNNNWNQVCHGGMIAAAIAVAEEEPELASMTIKRALEYIPNALAEYIPDGVYPEGPTYWSYGTSYTIMTAEMLKTAFGNDFGISQFPGFVESATFKVMCHAPSGMYYNFFDCGDRWSAGGDVIMAWFANQTGNKALYEEDRFLLTPSTSKPASLTGAALAWMIQFEGRKSEQMPDVWFGNGKNPVAIFNFTKEGHDYYLGAKGGCGSLNHGNMDAGSFVFELDGVRWVIDPGVQEYNELEQAGFDLWSSCQECDRWKLLTKNNFGHGTITVNDELHNVKGLVEMIGQKRGNMPEVTFNMTPAFNGLVDDAKRSFTKNGRTSLLIEDKIQINQNTKNITWQLITTADVEITSSGAILKQDGKVLYINNLSHPDNQPSVTKLDPPPFKLDKHIKNLKRLEFHYHAKDINPLDNNLNIRIILEN